MPVGPDPGLAPLVGSWRLLSAGITFADNAERWDPFGPNPEGCMVLSAGGRIVFLFMKPNRQPPATDAERAILFDDMVAYTGLVRMDGPGRFITTVDFAWTPAWRGEQVRLFTIDGDRLTIKTPEQTSPRSQGRLIVADLVWEREKIAV